MTTTGLSATDSALPPLSSFSVAMRQATTDSIRTTRLPHVRIPSTSTDLHVSTGVSQSASVIQRMTGELVNDIHEWLALSISMPEIEREVIVMPPPNKQRIVKVHVRYAGRAMPLISLDDIFVEPGSD